MSLDHVGFGFAVNKHGKTKRVIAREVETKRADALAAAFGQLSMAAHGDTGRLSIEWQWAVEKARDQIAHSLKANIIREA